MAAGFALMSLALGCARGLGQSPPAAGEVVSIAAMAPEQSVELEELTTEQALQLRLAERTLLSEAADIRPEDRRDAARLLLALDVPQAHAALTRALTTKSNDILAAVVAAMETSPVNPPVLLDPLIEALLRSPEQMWDPFGRVTGRYGELAAVGLGKPARDRSLPATQRLAAIRALGAVLSPDAAEQLIDVLRNEQFRDAAILDAACESLERMTGVQHGRDPALWLNWWDVNKDKSPGEWQQLYIHSLRINIGDLQKQLQQERKLRSDAATRLTEALRELFAMLPPAQQLSRLPDMLGDPMVEVREFALSRVDQRLRDSEPIPEDIQRKLIERLDDPVARVRERAAQQLDLANHSGISALLIERLDSQSDQSVVAQWMAILGRRAAPDAFQPAIQRLRPGQSAGVIDAAAVVIWSLADAQLLNESQQQQAIEAARQAMAERTSPALMRVVAALGTADEAQRLVAELQSTDAAVRAAVAQGLAWRKWSEPLLNHAMDPAVYPHALKLVAARTPGEQTLRALINLPPPRADLTSRWQQAVTAAAHALPREDLLMVDDLLAAAPAADLPLRIEVLRPVGDMTPNGNGMNPRLRANLLLRLAELLAANGAAAAAHDALQQLPDVPLNDEEIRLRLRVALLAGNYDRASEIDHSPQAWVECFADLVDQNTAAARALRDEIHRRFGDDLDGSALESFDAASARLDAALAERLRPNGGPGS